MYEEKKDALKTFASLAFTTGLALATQGSGDLVMGFLNNVAGNLASSYIEKTSYKKIRQLIQQPNPSDLNHDLQRLVVKSVEWAIQNIEILYGKKLSAKEQKQQLTSFTKNLLAEVKVLNDTLSSSSKVPLYQTIESSANQATLLKTFDLQVADFPVINPENPYPRFFQEQFQPNLQLCFGELLKDEKNRPALIAYQREITQSLENGIDKIIAQNDSILEKLGSNAEVVNENAAYQEMKTVIAQRPDNDPDPFFIASIESQISPLKQQYAVLLEQNVQILEEVGKVKAIAKGINKDLKQNWFEKNKVYVLSIGGMALLVIFGLVYSLQTQPFDLVLNIEKNKSINVHSDYPKPSDQAQLRIYLPHETKVKQLTFDNEILLNDIPSDHAGASCKIELVDPYWQVSVDSIQLIAPNRAIPIEPNEALSIVSGRVLSRDGQVQISGAKVFVDDQSTTTDDLGKFTLEVPIADRKPSYRIRIEAIGYLAAEKLYYPGSDIEFRLEK